MRRTRTLSLVAATSLAAGLSLATVLAAAPASAITPGVAAVVTATPPATTATATAITSRPLISPTVTRTSPSLVADAMCFVNWYVQSQTATTFQALVTFRNPTSGTIAPPWTLSWSFANGQTITAILGGATSFSQTGTRVTVSGTETVAGGQSHSFIVTGTWNGYTNTTPTGFSLKPPPGVYFFSCTVTTAAPQTTPAVITSAAPATCVIDYQVPSWWPGGFQANVAITNKGAPITGWTVRFTFPNGQRVTQLWSGVNQSSGSDVVVGNASWNGNLPTDGTAWFGFQAAGDGPSSQPTTATLNGVPCQVI
ncbi:cellulose binding domain-containing protein [Luedemannella helvata]|uniref:CBM2 domain-containing protein n=1 Tax=Luedemannella helvata TaxID=349315 RepID=A0ABP4WZ25_9ACTN